MFDQQRQQMSLSVVLTEVIGEPPRGACVKYRLRFCQHV